MGKWNSFKKEFFHTYFHPPICSW